MDSAVEVLLVEDNANDVLFMQRAWRRSQIPNPLRVVSNGAECLEYLQKSTRDTLGLILMDIDMPRMNGLECLEQIRANDDYDHLPVVMLSGSQKNHTVSQSYKIGCNSFIEKPSDYAELQQTVKLIHTYWKHNRLPIE